MVPIGVSLATKGVYDPVIESDSIPSLDLQVKLTELHNAHAVYYSPLGHRQVEVTNPIAKESITR